MKNALTFFGVVASGLCLDKFVVKPGLSGHRPDATDLHVLRVKHPKTPILSKAVQPFQNLSKALGGGGGSADDVPALSLNTG